MGLNAGHALGHVEGNVVLARVAQQRLAFQVVRTRLLDADDCGLVLVSLVDLGRVAGTGQARDLAELHRARPAAAATGDAERADTADQDHPLRDHRAGTLNETARCAGFQSIVCSVGRLAAGLLDGRPAGNKKSGVGSSAGEHATNTICESAASASRKHSVKVASITFCRLPSVGSLGRSGTRCSKRVNAPSTMSPTCACVKRPAVGSLRERLRPAIAGHAATRTTGLPARLIIQWLLEPQGLPSGQLIADTLQRAATLATVSAKR